MTQERTSIIPNKQTFATIEGAKVPDLEAICVFVAIGFFLDDDTYWKNKKVLKAASNHTFNSDGILVHSKPWFKWHYTPRDITFDQALHEFTELFETIVKEQSLGKKVILPLSGGLDSRTQAAALKRINADVFSYSYEFENGFKETKISEDIAKACDFEFKSFEIKKGYLWKNIDTLFQLNKGYSDFTAPRQMAIFDAYAEMGNVFSLGHWGDVLFDSMNLPKLTKEEELEVIQTKLLKKGGLELATKLWNAWGLQGDFKNYFKLRIEVLLETIKIEDTNAKLRAFKSMYWAPRWTSINLSIFEAKQNIALPYYDDRMCAFICGIPEAYLKNRQLQIAYIKAKAPELEKITWQEQIPFNLTNFEKNRVPYNIPYKLGNKIKRIFNQAKGKKHVLRNWELQFLGESNQEQVSMELYDSKLSKFVPEVLINDCYDGFYQKDALQYAHAINMLLVLSKFTQNNEL